MKLVLGTVQYGIAYGINNTYGIPGNSELTNIFNQAYQSGIRILDTAMAYGNAEERIAELSESKFNVISKFSGVGSKSELEYALNSSLKRLKTENLYGYIFHNANDLIKYPELWEELVQARDILNKVNKIGYSLYDTEQIDNLFKQGFIPDIVQLPYSILDRKFEKYLPELKERNVEIHTRSAFLQGLYFMNPDQLPLKLHPLKSTLLYLHSLCEQFETSISSLALNYVLKNPNVDFVVIGIDSSIQLAQNLNIVNEDLDPDLMNLVNDISVSNPELLHPGNWKS